jgi:hypothetical protein
MSDYDLRIPYFSSTVIKYLFILDRLRMASKCCSRCANTLPLSSFLADPSNPKSKIRLTCIKCRTENRGARGRMKRKALESLDPNVPSKRPAITRTKPTEIIHAFQNSGIWPVDMNIAIQKLQKYSKPTLLPQTPTTIPQTFRDSESQLQLWKAKIPILLSSPSRPQFHDWVTGTEQVLVSGQLQEFDYSILESRMEEQRKAKSKSRRSLKNGGALTATQAREIQSERLEKELTKTAKKAARITKSLAIQARKQLHRAVINARKEERLRKKKVAALVRSNQPVPPELEEPIPDPEELTKQEHATETESDSSNRSDDEDSIN